jgi:hypothetical protein
VRLEWTWRRHRALPPSAGSRYAAVLIMAGEAIRIVFGGQSGLWSKYSPDYGWIAVRIVVIVLPGLWSEHSPDYGQSIVRIMVGVQSGLWVRVQSGLWSEYSPDYGRSTVRIMVRVQSGLWSDYSPDYSQSSVRIMARLQSGLWSEYSPDYSAVSIMVGLQFVLRSTWVTVNVQDELRSKYSPVFWVQSGLWFHISQYSTHIPLETAAWMKIEKLLSHHWPLPEIW